MVVQTCNPNLWEVEAEASRNQGHPWLHSELAVSLSYSRPCLQTRKRTNNQTDKVIVRRVKYVAILYGETQLRAIVVWRGRYRLAWITGASITRPTGPEESVMADHRSQRELPAKDLISSSSPDTCQNPREIGCRSQYLPFSSPSQSSRWHLLQLAGSGEVPSQLMKAVLAVHCINPCCSQPSSEKHLLAIASS